MHGEADDIKLEEKGAIEKELSLASSAGTGH
jgi:hypothetical protein